MESNYYLQFIFFALLLFIPKTIEYCYQHSLSAREMMIVKFAQYKSYSYASIFLFFLIAIGANLFQDARIYMLVFFLAVFGFYTYKHLFSYIVYKKEHFPTAYLFITLLQPIALLIAIILLSIMIYKV